MTNAFATGQTGNEGNERIGAGAAGRAAQGAIIGEDPAMNGSTGIAGIGPMEFDDAELEARYGELAGAPATGGRLDGGWFVFPAGTGIDEIREWFDGEHSEGLAGLEGGPAPDGGARPSVTERAYAAKSSAARALKKAVARGELAEGAWEVRRAEDGFRVVCTEGERPKARAAAAARELPGPQREALRALFAAPPLSGLTDGERADVWFAFSEIYSSGHPATPAPRSMGGIMRGLVGRGLVDFVANGKEHIGKRAIAVRITASGLAALQA